jgi:hypothetical protein
VTAPQGEPRLGVDDIERVQWEALRRAAHLGQLLPEGAELLARIHERHPEWVELAAEQARGHCIGCGRGDVAGVLVNDVDTNSGTGWTNVLCGSCQAVGKSPWRALNATDP